MGKDIFKRIQESEILKNNLEALGLEIKVLYWSDTEKGNKAWFGRFYDSYMTSNFKHYTNIHPLFILK
jgi:hypothetical protein